MSAQSTFSQLQHRPHRVAKYKIPGQNIEFVILHLEVEDDTLMQHLTHYIIFVTRTRIYPILKSNHFQLYFQTCFSIS